MATGGNQQMASPLAEFGSFSVKDSAVNSTIHLCRCRDGSKAAYVDKVKAIRASALVLYTGVTPPSGLQGVEVLCVGGRSWDAVVSGLQQAESDGHRSVAVLPGNSGYIEKLFDHAASRRAFAATDIWVVWGGTTSLLSTYNLSMWQQQLSDDARYQLAAALQQKSTTAKAESTTKAPQLVRKKCPARAAVADADPVGAPPAVQAGHLRGHPPRENAHEYYQKKQDEVDVLLRQYDFEVVPVSEERFTENIERSEEIYALSNQVRGICFIVNMRNFPSRPDKKRSGSEKDTAEMCVLFTKLNFQIKLYEDLQKKQLREVIRSINGLQELRDHQAFVTIIMSHGHADHILCSDMKTEKIKNIITSFNNYHCNALKGKPKIMIIQACRGDEVDFGVEMDAEDEDNYVPKLATESDMFIAYASQTERPAYRHREKGAIFIQAIKDVFKDQAHEEDIHGLFTKVNRHVNDYESERRGKMIPHPQYSLTKKLYFNPGRH